MCMLLLIAGIVAAALSVFLLFQRPVTIKQFKYSTGQWDVINETNFKVTMDVGVSHEEHVYLVYLWQPRGVIISVVSV